LLINLGSENFEINNGDRIAQIIVAPVTFAMFIPVSELSETERGSGGFGSTGVSTYL
jgi:dUTP pyrophosphatase